MPLFAASDVEFLVYLIVWLALIFGGLKYAPFHLFAGIFGIFFAYYIWTVTLSPVLAMLLFGFAILFMISGLFRQIE